jgi:hypothetical protein
MLRRVEEQACDPAFQETGHPIIQSFEPGEAWGWCFVDRALFDHLPATY